MLREHAYFIAGLAGAVLERGFGGEGHQHFFFHRLGKAEPVLFVASWGRVSLFFDKEKITPGHFYQSRLFNKHAKSLWSIDSKLCRTLYSHYVSRFNMTSVWIQQRFIIISYLRIQLRDFDLQLRKVFNVILDCDIVIAFCARIFFQWLI